MATKTPSAAHLYALPPIPASIPSVLGPVPVTHVENLRDKNGVACFGIWNPDTRSVRLDSDMALTTAWSTYWHEWLHITLWDSGVELKSKLAERLCDTVATARVREMLDGGGAHG
jgi:hypothetical protein